MNEAFISMAHRSSYLRDQVSSEVPRVEWSRDQDLSLRRKISTPRYIYSSGAVVGTWTYINEVLLKVAVSTLF
jgi:hypothetical protein